MGHLIEYRGPTDEEKGLFLEWMRDHMGATVGAVMEFLELDWQEFARLFGTVGEVRAIECDRRLAGFIWIEKRKRDLHVHGIILQPEYRGKGLGGRIFDDLAAEFRDDVDAFELGVRTSNDGAIRFYERRGFRLHRTIEDVGFRIYRKLPNEGPAEPTT